MNELTEKIAKNSKVILILSKVARIILYVMAGITIAMLTASFLQLPNPLFTIFGKPVYLYDLTEGMTMKAFQVELAEALVQIGVAVALLFIVSDLFRHIQTSASPFNETTVRKLKAMGIMLGVVVFINNGYLGVVVAFIGYALALIFQYGGLLQQQVDETL